jgi:plastocyanin
VTIARRSLAALGGFALFVAALVVMVPAPASARTPTVYPLVTVHIRDNVFSPADLAVEPGTTVRWVNDPGSV